MLNFSLVKLEDICEIVSGFAFQSKYFKRNNSNGVPVIRIQNIGDGREEEFVYWENEYDPKFLVYPGDILLSLSGNIKVDVWKGPKALLNQRIVKLVPKQVNLEWLYLAIQNKIDNITRLGKKSIINNVSVRELKAFEFNLPSKEVQNYTASVLKKAKILIDKRKEQIEILDELKQNVFFEIFGDPRVNSLNWEIKSLGDIVNIENSRRVPIKSADRKKITGKYPYYGATGIVDYINDYRFDGEYLLISEDGKALVSRNKPIAFLVSGKFWVNNHAHVLSYNGKCNLVYLERLIDNINIRSFVTGIDQYKLNRSNLEQIPIMLPPIKLQKQYELKMNNIELQKLQLLKGKDYLEKLYQSLMQRAFKGELFTDEYVSNFS